MNDQAPELLAYIQSRLAELNTIHEQAEKALNAVQGKDHVTKWKRKVVEELTPLVSPPTFNNCLPNGWKPRILSGMCLMNWRMK